MNKVDPDLEALEATISALKEATKPAEASSGAKAKGEAMRFASDFIAATAVGTVLGFAVDSWLGSKPIGIVIGLMLGCAAGVKMIWSRIGK
jgi:ATP synthase protein I